MTELSQTPSLNLLATCPKGIEGLLADELQALGAEPGKTTVAGVYFTADQATAYRVCLWSRLANRVILLLARESMIETAEQVRDVVARIAWRQHLAPGRTLAVDFHGRSEHIRHTRFGAQTVKDGVVDSLQLSGQERPNVDTKTPDLRLYAHLHRANLSLVSTSPARAFIGAATGVTSGMRRSRRTRPLPCWCVQAGPSAPGLASLCWTHCAGLALC